MNAITTTSGPLISFIERAAVNPEFDVQKFGELLRMQRDMEHDLSRRMFNASMADAQADMMPVVRDATNTHLRNKYARLETIDAAIRPVYTRHGFSVRYGSAPCPAEGSIRITCTVAHSGGYFEENYLDSPVSSAGSQGGKTATTPVQAIGSAVTYLRRYLLAMVFNVVLADEDDDGEAMRRAPASRYVEPEQQGDYEFITKHKTSRMATADEWIAAWRRLISNCQAANALDKLAAARDMNEHAIAAAWLRDTRAASEVRGMIASAMPPVEPVKSDFPGDWPSVENAPENAA